MLIYDVCAVFDSFVVVTVYFYLIFDICLPIIITPRIIYSLAKKNPFSTPSIKKSKSPVLKQLPRSVFKASQNEQQTMKLTLSACENSRLDNEKNITK